MNWSSTVAVLTRISRPMRTIGIGSFSVLCATARDRYVPGFIWSAFAAKFRCRSRVSMLLASRRARLGPAAHQRNVRHDEYRPWHGPRASHRAGQISFARIRESVLFASSRAPSNLATAQSPPSSPRCDSGATNQPTVRLFDGRPQDQGS
jgi:hypothetical protein